jgi:hypothetical protein
VARFGATNWTMFSMNMISLLKDSEFSILPSVSWYNLDLGLLLMGLHTTFAYFWF